MYRVHYSKENYFFFIWTMLFRSVNSVMWNFFYIGLMSVDSSGGEKNSFENFRSELRIYAIKCRIFIFLQKKYVLVVAIFYCSLGMIKKPPQIMTLQSFNLTAFSRRRQNIYHTYLPCSFIRRYKIERNKIKYGKAF